jgi:hypothetical protein
LFHRLVMSSLLIDLVGRKLVHIRDAERFDINLSPRLSV